MYEILDQKVHFKIIYSYQMWKWMSKKASGLIQHCTARTKKKQNEQHRNKTNQKTDLLASLTTSFSFHYCLYCHIILKMGRSWPWNFILVSENTSSHMLIIYVLFKICVSYFNISYLNIMIYEIWHHTHYHKFFMSIVFLMIINA